MSSFTFKPEFFQVYTGEDRVLPLRVINLDGTPFSLVGVTEIEVRFKKADNGVLSKKYTSASEVTKFTFSYAGSYYNLVGSKNIQLDGNYFWFKVTDGSYTQVDPVLVGVGHRVDILMADTPAQIATKFYNSILLVSGFTATNLVSGQVIVTNVTPSDVPDATGTAATINIQTYGYASGVTVINGVLGKLSVSVSSTDTSQFLIGERQSFAVTFTFPTGIRKVNYRTSLTVDKQAV